MHDDQVDLTLDQMQALVADNFPELADLPLRPIHGPGTVNAIVRIGQQHAARFPLRLMPESEVRQWLEREAAATAEIAEVATVPVPEVLGLGRPGHGYPLWWSVQTWLDGETGHESDPGGSDAFADDLVELVAALRGADTRGRRFSGSGRGGELEVHDPWVQTCLANSGHLLDVDALSRLWEELRGLPLQASEVMTHGDLIPGNVLVRDGRLIGLLDCGGFAPADPALELVGAWHLLDAGPRERVRTGLGSSDLEWRRGMAWALVQALGLGWYYEHSNPLMAQLGIRTLGRLLELA